MAHRYRYLRAANCMCGQCHAAHAAIEEWSNGFSTTTNKNDLAPFEYFVLSFPTLVQIPSLPSDSFSRPFSSSSGQEITVLLEINVIGDRSRTYGFVAHPGARRIIDGLQTAGFGVALFSCEGVKEPATQGQIQRAGAGYRRGTAAAPPRYPPRGCADSPRPRGVTLARFCAASPTPLRVTARFVQIWALFGGSGGSPT
eukprot:COSAG03_NODE_3039_length_2272_cov_2.657616_1_plen_199_part_00